MIKVDLSHFIFLHNIKPEIRVILITLVFSTRKVEPESWKKNQDFGLENYLNDSTEP